ncbi:Uncharacterized protein DAT39_008990 [Clarias magur]|uniref:Uncharacterized protein n=1 Tax=Clarias magur TaxID=1594786 RepID=A0A8J4U7K5_CLAMG|nr:Uncharacterized protein DAT39_008990 [Clarias magur]
MVRDVEEWTSGRKLEKVVKTHMDTRRQKPDEDWDIRLVSSSCSAHHIERKTQRALKAEGARNGRVTEEREETRSKNERMTAKKTPHIPRTASPLFFNGLMRSVFRLTPGQCCPSARRRNETGSNTMGWAKIETRGTVLPVDFIHHSRKKRLMQLQPPPEVTSGQKG